MVAASWWSAPDARKRVLTRGLLLASMSALVISPWAIRNYRELGGFIPLRSNFGLELAVGNNDSANGIGYDPALGRIDPQRTSPMHPFRNPEERAQLLRVGEHAYMKAKQREGMEWIRAHTGRFAALTARRFALYWFPTPDLWTARAPLRAFKAAISGVIGAGALLGLVMLFVSRHPYRWFFLAACSAPRRSTSSFMWECGTGIPSSVFRLFLPHGWHCVRSDPSGGGPEGRETTPPPASSPGDRPLVCACRVLLTRPWARGRFILVLGVSRSPGAALLVVLTLVGLVAVSFTAAARFRYLTLAGAGHLAMGALMGAGSWAAFHLVRHAGVKFLGFVPLTSIHPGQRTVALPRCFVHGHGAGPRGDRGRPVAPATARARAGTRAELILGPAPSTTKLQVLPPPRAVTMPHYPSEPHNTPSTDRESHL